ncbi:MAG: hypothetical protein GY834_02215, partial [Bacteroidetes bacterium]|nr:hypothetical protein [Bacteroidota bacterium]
MANTLKFGAGNWATKEGSTLAYNDLNSNFKPLPFTFTRASNATVVNKAGLIETVGNGIPRIDFLGNTQGALKLEPQRTNLITQSEAFDNSYWTKNGASVTSGFTSPDGTNNAYKLVEGTSNSIHRMYQTATVSASPNASISIYVKYNGRKFVLMRIADSGVGRWYDIENGVLGGTFQGTPNDSSIESVGNGWYRITISHTVSNQARLELWVSDTESTSAYQGNGTSGVYIYGAQLEVGSYSTSLIKTQGSTVTRLKDNAYKENATQVIGQSEGTMFLEFVPQYASSTQILYQIRSNTGTVGQVDFRLQSGNIIALGNDGGSTQFFIDGGSYTVGSKYKLAVRYKLNDSKFYINGVSVGNDTSCSFTGSSLNQVSFGENLYSFLPIANIIDARLYNTGLSDSELQALTQV